MNAEPAADADNTLVMKTGASQAYLVTRDFLKSQGIPQQYYWAAAEHPETEFAWMMRQAGIQSTRVMITNDYVCDACKVAIPQILPDGSTVTITYAGGADGSMISTDIDGVGPPVDG